MRRRPGRIAAILALVAAAVVVVSLALLVVRNVPALLIALGALLIAGAAGWIAVTRRGATRVLAAAAAAAALVGAAIGLVVLGAVDELVLLVLATGAFAVATRRALRGAATQGAATAQPVSRAARPRRAILLMNPKSGGGKVEKFDLVGEARRRRIEPVLLEPGDDLRALAHDAARSAEVIGMAGGDGSQALVAQVAMEHDLPYVCIPAGTRNHLALDLGLDRDDVVGALDAFIDGGERRIDLAFVNDRIFVNNVSLGIYAEIVQSEAYRDAKLATVETMLPELLGPDATPFDLRFRGPDGSEHETAQLILVSNNRYVLDRLGGIGSRPSLDTGRLGIVTVHVANAAQAAKLVSLNAARQLSRFEGWREWSATEFEVASTAPVATGIDGEAVVLEPPLRFTIVPGALTVLLPPTVPGLSPAALQPGFTSSTLRDLWQIAAGRQRTADAPGQSTNGDAG
ncbi:MAG: diacylglycerol/lipid kinase family protein [Solirubrobacteraceae bacterium]